MKFLSLPHPSCPIPCLTLDLVQKLRPAEGPQYSKASKLVQKLKQCGFFVSTVHRRDVDALFNALALLQLYGVSNKGEREHSGRFSCGKSSEEVWVIIICI